MFLCIFLRIQSLVFQGRVDSPALGPFACSYLYSSPRQSLCGLPHIVTTVTNEALPMGWVPSPAPWPDHATGGDAVRWQAHDRWRRQQPPRNANGQSGPASPGVRLHWESRIASRVEPISLRSAGLARTSGACRSRRKRALVFSLSRPPGHQCPLFQPIKTPFVNDAGKNSEDTPPVEMSKESRGYRDNPQAILETFLNYLLSGVTLFGPHL